MLDLIELNTQPFAAVTFVIIITSCFVSSDSVFLSSSLPWTSHSVDWAIENVCYPLNRVFLISFKKIINHFISIASTPSLLLLIFPSSSSAVLLDWALIFFTIFSIFTAQMGKAGLKYDLVQFEIALRKL